MIERVSPVESEECALDDCFNRVLAQDTVALIDIPPFANSSMDGFALRSVDTDAADEAVALTVVGVVQAGAADLPLVGPRQAARIMTGAPMPPGADAVVPFEETSFEDGTVTVPSGRVRGSCVRPAGLDVRLGDGLIAAGTRLGPAHIALAASTGLEMLRVFRRPVVAILATGDELVDVGRPLGPGQIYNSNAHGLAAAVRAVGANPVLLKPAKDDVDALRDVFGSISGVDLILTSGGVSVGDFDYVRTVIEEIGAVDFWRIRMRPGKPLMLGTVSTSSEQMVPILGLPGNPTSTMVTFHVFARPLILALMGVSDPLPASITAIARERLDNRGDRETYFRVILEVEDGRYTIRLAGEQDSSMLSPLARANALARVPADIEYVEAGSAVEAFPF